MTSWFFFTLDKELITDKMVQCFIFYFHNVYTFSFVYFSHIWGILSSRRMFKKLKDLELIYWKDFLPNTAPHNTSWEFEVFLNGSEQLYRSVCPRLSLLLAADSSQRLSRVDQRQHCSLKVLPAQRLPALGQLCHQTVNVGEPLGQDVVTDDLQLLDVPHGGQLLVWDQHGVFCAVYLHSSQQDLGNIRKNTQELTKKYLVYRLFLSSMSRNMYFTFLLMNSRTASAVSSFFKSGAFSIGGQTTNVWLGQIICTFSTYLNWFPVMNRRATNYSSPS